MNITEVLGSLSMILMEKMDNWKWQIQWPFFTKFELLFVKLHKNTYGRAFEFADHDSVVKKWKIQNGGLNRAAIVD